ncbi:MAG: tellurite resistance TerB family protein [Pseudomonadota bacterium]
MIDPKKILSDFLGSNMPGTQGSVRDTAGKGVQMAKDNPLATGAIAAVLLGTGIGRSLSGSALKLGGAAAVAGLAYTAYKNYKDGQKPVTASEPPELIEAPAGSDFDLENGQDNADEFALTLVKAMIAAARADGHIDDDERAKIAEKLEMSGADDDAASFIRAELAKPVDLDQLVANAKTEAQRVELYTASRLAIDPQTRAERGYLDMLAGRLQLPDPLVDHIEATVAGAVA